MARLRLSRHQRTEPVLKSSMLNDDSLNVRSLNRYTAALLVGAGAVAVIVPVSILSLLLFLMGA